MAIKRSEFLRLSAWGFVASLLPLHQVKAISFISKLKDYNQDDYIIAVDKAKQAKEHFFKKEYSESITLYLECIELAPSDIRFYDNLQNVYGAQGAWSMCAELFRNGLIANPNKIAFYDRAARALMRLELGYPLMAQQYREETNSDSLLQDAKALYNQALEIAPNTKYLKIGKQKVKRKIDTDALNINYLTNEEEKAKRKQRRREHKKRYNKFSIEELQERIFRIENKTRNTLYFENEQNTRDKNIIKEKMLIYTFLAKRFKQNNQYQEAINSALEVYTLDKNNTKIVKTIKKLCRKSDAYDQLIDFQRTHIENTQTVFSNLGLMNALSLKFKKQVQDYSLLEEAITIGEDLLLNWGLVDILRVNVVDKLADVYILNGNISNSKNLVRETIETIPIKSEGLINNLIFDYAKAYFKNNEYSNAKNILLIGVKDFQTTEIDIFDYVRSLSNKKTENVFESNLRLYYLLFRTYKKLNDDDNKYAVLQHILESDPNNKFALKRI